MKYSKLIIIGSGPAGLTAGIYAGRANLKPIIISKDITEGVLSKISRIENFPGFPNGIDGKTLLNNMTQQAINSKAEIINDTIIGFSIKDNKKILTGNNETYECDFLIIATGQSQIKQYINGEKELLGFGVSTCTTCDAPFFKNKTIAVYGNSKKIFQEIDYLLGFANKICFICHAKNIYNQSIPNHFLENEKIQIISDSKITAINGDRKKGVISISLENNNNEKSEIPVDGIFIINEPSNNLKLFNDYLKFDDRGFIITNDSSTQTNIEGIFAIGDAVSNNKKQIVIAAATGAEAILELLSLNNKQKKNDKEK